MGVHELQDRDHDVIEGILRRVAARSGGAPSTPGIDGRGSADGSVATGTSAVPMTVMPGVTPRVGRPLVHQDRGPLGQSSVRSAALGGTRCATPVVIDVGYRMGRWARLATTVTVLVAGLVVALTLPTDPVPARTVQTTVLGGETLWELAARVAPASDPAVTVDRIAALNPGVPGSPEAGAVLTVPMPG